MKSVHIHDYGGLDVLHYEDAPRLPAQEKSLFVFMQLP